MERKPGTSDRSKADPTGQSESERARSGKTSGSEPASKRKSKHPEERAKVEEANEEYRQREDSAVHNLEDLATEIEKAKKLLGKDIYRAIHDDALRDSSLPYAPSARPCPKCNVACPCCHWEEVDIGVGVQVGDEQWICLEHGPWGLNSELKTLFRDNKE